MYNAAIFVGNLVLTTAVNAVLRHLSSAGARVATPMSRKMMETLGPGSLARLLQLLWER
jgi:hypothetical protein